VFSFPARHYRGGPKIGIVLLRPAPGAEQRSPTTLTADYKRIVILRQRSRPRSERRPTKDLCSSGTKQQTGHPISRALREKWDRFHSFWVAQRFSLAIKPKLSTQAPQGTNALTLDSPKSPEYVSSFPRSRAPKCP